MRFLFWKAVIGLAIFDLLGFGSNFAKLHKCVCNYKVAQSSAPDIAMGRVCQAVNYACVWYPKRVLCLQRSFITTCLLRRMGVNAQLVLGAQKMPFKAHAWTEVDGRTINERHNVQAIYAVWERC
jgi:Transglutaminase-like superfamily